MTEAEEFSGRQEMKAMLKKPAVRAIAVLLVAVLLGVSVVTIVLATQGVKGINSPSWTVPVIRSLASGGRGATPAPFAATGYVMSKTSNYIHMWVYSCSEALTGLGVKQGDTIEIMCTRDQVRGLEHGDWVQFVGITVGGSLVLVSPTTLPQPFGY